MKQYCSTNNRIKILAHLAYFIFAILYSLASLLGVHWFVYLKVLPLVIMVALLIPFRRLPYRKLVIIGLVFGLVGDLVLEHGGQSLFSIGAGAFLINQILYNLYLLSLWGNGSGAVLYRRRYTAFIITVLFICLSSVNLSTAISDANDRMLVMLLPVYAVFLNFTAILPFIVNLAQKGWKLHLIGLIIGGCCFFISDNVLGRRKLTGRTIFEERMYDSLLIMGTYYIAQYFIPLSAMYDSPKESKQDEESSLLQSQIE